MDKNGKLGTVGREFSCMAIGNSGWLGVSNMASSFPILDSSIVGAGWCVLIAAKEPY